MEVVSASNENSKIWFYCANSGQRFKCSIELLYSTMYWILNKSNEDVLCNSRPDKNAMKNKQIKVDFYIAIRPSNDVMSSK